MLKYHRILKIIRAFVATLSLNIQRCTWSGFQQYSWQRGWRGCCAARICFWNSGDLWNL